MPRSRIRFTLAHEIAHILLGHEMKINIIGNFRSKYTVENKDEFTNNPIESEANIFAASLMAPACVLWALNIKDENSIMELCGLSYTSAKVRLERMKILYKRNAFLTSPLEKQVYKQFLPFIESNILRFKI